MDQGGVRRGIVVGVETRGIGEEYMVSYEITSKDQKKLIKLSDLCNALSHEARALRMDYHDHFRVRVPYGRETSLCL